MRSLFFALLIIMTFGVASVVLAVAHVEDFNGADLDPMWRYRDPLGNGDYRLEEGKFILDLKAGADMYIQGTDGGVMILMEPPALEDYTVELKMNATVAGFMPPATHVGPVLFNEDVWAYTAWGPYAATDIRLEDCVAADYRWRDQTQIGINQTDIPIDEDLWLQIVKTGTSLEFFAKGNEDDDWISGGVDEKLGPNYTPGNYEVGIVFKSWGGSIDGTFEIDYFNIPEIAAVDATGKLATTWAAVK